jgi:hypothetical protein
VEWGLCWFIPGVAEGYRVTLAAHLFGQPKVSKQVQSLWPVAAAAAWGWRPTCSLSVLWHGEVIHGLGIQCAKVSTLPGASPPPSVAPASQQGT